MRKGFLLTSIIAVSIFIFGISECFALMHIAVSNDNNFVFMENDGKGKLTLKHELGTGNPLPHGIVSADFNQDAIFDVAVCHWQRGSFSVFLGKVDDKGIGFVGPDLYTIGGGAAIHALNSGDFNADGFADLALVDNRVSPRSVFIFINDGKGNFIQHSKLEIDQENTNSRSITVSDFNNDGHLDLVVPDASTQIGHLTLFLGKGNAGFARKEVSFPETMGSLYIMVAEDINRDGYADLIAANGMYVTIVFNEKGEFKRVVNMQVGKPDPQNPVLSVSVGDFNHDGIFDIAAIKPNGLYVFLGTNPGEFKPGSLTRWPFIGSVMDIKTADFDGERNLDLAVGVFGSPWSASDTEVAIFRGKADGSFPAEDSAYFSSGRSERGYQTMLALYPDPRFVRGDVNEDGKIDLGDAIFILSYLFANGEKPTCLDIIDVDDDGRLTIGDAIYLLNYLFISGPEPKAPFPDAGFDPTEDALTCTGER